MTYLVAVSGGVDSVVLLDLLAQSDHRLIVAHVDHGIREDSAADARFVEGLAKQYNLPFVSTRFELGESASEEQARRVRYDYLEKQAETFSGRIVTAHHQNDLVETVVINMSRGTGWRGLAVLGRGDLYRPLLSMSKEWIYQYALQHRLEWVEDSTNSDERYLRNRLRKKLAQYPVNAEQVARLRTSQLQLKKAIAHEVRRLSARHRGSRHFLTQLDNDVAVELLGYDIAREIGVRPTRPQLIRALLAVKTAKVGTTHHVGDQATLHFSARKYQVSVL